MNCLNTIKKITGWTRYFISYELWFGGGRNGSDGRKEK